ncbi:MAG TPA: glutaredoxin family protein [Thermoleophilaceae bacterium]|nr:glutaredoxin family protein [Thermoleophilaceae bacterium]
MTVVTLYGKPGCCLCDDAREIVAIVRRDLPFELHEVDVSVDPALHREYGERIPVLEIDGDEVSELGVDPLELRRRLAKVTT